jgi:plasmid stability protein
LTLSVIIAALLLSLKTLPGSLLRKGRGVPSFAHRAGRKRTATDIDITAIIDYDEISQTDEAAIAMSSITVRNLDPAIKNRLRVRAAEHGHSMEAEARRIPQGGRDANFDRTENPYAIALPAAARLDNGRHDPP